MRTIIIAAFLTALSSSAAHADWQFTRWGMSVAEVEKAAKGKLWRNDDRRKDKESQRAVLAGTYVGGGMPFDSLFYFRKSKLVGVSLELMHSTCSELVGQLHKTYGASSYKDEGRTMDVMRWDDRRNNNGIVYLRIGEGMCRVEYSPLEAANKPGGL